MSFWIAAAGAIRSMTLPRGFRLDGIAACHWMVYSVDIMSSEAVMPPEYEAGRRIDVTFPEALLELMARLVPPRERNAFIDRPTS